MGWRTTGVLIALTVVCVAAAVAQTGGDWPTFRGKAQNTGVAHSPLAANLALKWTYETGGSVESTAAIVGDTVYVGTMTGALHAINLSTGRMRWKFVTGGSGISAAPLVQGGTVYVGDEGGTFYAINTANGTLRWKFTTDGKIASGAIFVADSVLFGSYDNHLYRVRASDGAKLWSYEADAQVHCTPCEAGGLVMIASCDGVLRIIDLATGRQVRAAMLGGNFAGAPAYASGVVYVGGLEGKYYAVRLSDAAIVWQHEEPSRTSGIYASAAVMGDAVVFASRSNNVFRVDRATGNVAWTFATRSDVDSSPVINGSHVIFGSSDGNVYRVDHQRLTGGRPAPAGHRRRGRRRLLLRVGPQRRPDHHEPQQRRPEGIHALSQAHHRRDRRHVHTVGAFAADWPNWRGPDRNGIAPDTGINKDWNARPPQVLWQTPMHDDGYAGPSVAEGKVFIVDHDGADDVVRAIDLETGQDLWQARYPDLERADYGFTRSTPVYDSGRIYVVSYLGQVHCLDAATGEIVWAVNMRRQFGGVSPQWGYAMSALIDGDRVVVVPGGPDACVAALDRRATALARPMGDRLRCQRRHAHRLGRPHLHHQQLPAGLRGDRHRGRWSPHRVGEQEHGLAHQHLGLLQRADVRAEQPEPAVPEPRQRADRVGTERLRARRPGRRRWSAHRHGGGQRRRGDGRGHARTLSRTRAHPAAGWAELDGAHHRQRPPDHPQQAGTGLPGSDVAVRYQLTANSNGYGTRTAPRGVGAPLVAVTVGNP